MATCELKKWMIEQKRKELMGDDKMKGENRLVVANLGWAETLPEWLKEEISAERMVQGFTDVLKKGKEEVGDAEVCAYLYTLNLTQAVSHELAQVYIYISSKLMKRQGKKLMPFMEEQLKRGLESDEERELKDLKRILWQKRGGKIKSPLFDALNQLGKMEKRKVK